MKSEYFAEKVLLAEDFGRQDGAIISQDAKTQGTFGCQNNFHYKNEILNNAKSAKQLGNEHVYGLGVGKSDITVRKFSRKNLCTHRTLL